MKTHPLLIPAFTALLFAGAILTGLSGDKPAATVSAEKRAKILRSFDRIPMNTTAEDALLLRILIQTKNAKRGIEVGSANGFGAINMGIGFERTGGHLTTIDIDPEMVKKCRANVARMGLEKTVTSIEGDALEVLAKLEGKFDFIFIDAHKQDYLNYFKAVEAKLEPGAVVVADNVIRFGDRMPDFLEYMENSPDYEWVIIRASDEKKDGMGIGYKIR